MSDTAPTATAALLPHRGVVAVGGADRRQFLQGLISQDVDKIDETRAGYGAFLTPQGKFLHEFFIIAADDAILLDCERARAADLVTRLGRFRLRAKVEIEDRSDEWAVMAVFDGAHGTDASASFDLAAEPGAAASLSGDDAGYVFVDPRLAALGCRVVAPDPRSIAERLGLTVADADAFDELRLSLGVADGTRDLEVEKSTLLEANFDALNGVDWDKGCYIGQELTARTHYRGLVKRRLVPITFDGTPPARGTPIRQGDADVGEVLSAVAGHGLARLRLAALAESPAMTAGETPVTVVLPDWLRPFADPGAA